MIYLYRSRNLTVTYKSPSQKLRTKIDIRKSAITGASKLLPLPRYRRDPTSLIGSDLQIQFPKIGPDPTNHLADSIIPY